MTRRTPTLDDQWAATKKAFDAAVAKHGRRSLFAEMQWAKLNDLTTRLLRRDTRKRRSA